MFAGSTDVRRAADVTSLSLRQWHLVLLVSHIDITRLSLTQRFFVYQIKHKDPKMQSDTYSDIPALLDLSSYLLQICGKSSSETQPKQLSYLHTSSSLIPEIGTMENRYVKAYIATNVFIYALGMWTAPDGYPAARHRARLFDMLPFLVQDAYTEFILANMIWVSKNPCLFCCYYQETLLTDSLLSSLV